MHNSCAASKRCSESRSRLRRDALVIVSGEIFVRPSPIAIASIYVTANHISIQLFIRIFDARYDRAYEPSFNAPIDTKAR